MGKLGWLLWKDVLAEARRAERLPTLLLFSIVLLLTLHFALPPEHEARPLVAPGFLWAAVVFAGLLEVRRSLGGELQDGTMDGLRLAPMDPVVLYVSKVISSVAVLAVLEAGLVALTALFFGGDPGGIPAAIGVCVLGTIGLVAWGVLFSAVVGQARVGELVLPVLLFPLLVPQTIASVRLIGHFLGGLPADSPSTGFVLLLGFDVLSLGTSLLLFEYVLQE